MVTVQHSTLNQRNALTRSRPKVEISTVHNPGNETCRCAKSYAAQPVRAIVTNINIMVVWIITPLSLVSGYQCLERTTTSIFRTEVMISTLKIETSVNTYKTNEQNRNVTLQSRENFKSHTSR
jgi:hypothetical protein